MSDGWFRFRVGAFECVSLSDGRLTYPPEMLFGNVPPADVAAALAANGLPADRVVTPYTCLLIDGGEKRLLVDTGAGNLGQSAAAIFPSVDHKETDTGRLIANLRAAGYRPADVDGVVVTHAHPDHVNGTLDDDGRHLFPNAHFFVGADEWNFWFSAAAESAPSSMLAIARKNVSAMDGRVTLVGDGFEILPGFQVVATPGHTPGHLALAITSAGEQLLHVSDAVLFPLHLAFPAWRPVFDMDPERADASKRLIFERAADSGALVFAHHFPPFPGVGQVSRRGEGWRWEPLATGGGE